MRTAAASAAAGCVAAAVQAGLRRTPVAKHFERTNHRGETVTVLEGPAYAAGSLAAVAIGATGRTRRAALIAGAGAVVFGIIDDLAERPAPPDRDALDDPGASDEPALRPASKGLAGHIGALLGGRVTTGSAKILGITASSIAAAAALSPRSGDVKAGSCTTGSRAGRVVDVVLSGGVIAGSANLVNLFDLRPGRALKVTVLAVAGQAVLAAVRRRPTTLPVAVMSAAVAMLPGDLSESSMLGDSGANTAGALLGVQCIAEMPPTARPAVLAVVAAATFASEKVSFTAVIESTPGLRELDRLGRRWAE